MTALGLLLAAVPGRAQGIITTVAGNGQSGFSGDGGPATSASLRSPYGVAADAAGNLYIADPGDNRIRKISANGTITTVAGDGIAGFSGDGGPAIAASLAAPHGVAVDAAGNLYIADSNNNRIRKVDASGVITTVAGNGIAGFSGDGGSATGTSLFGPYGVVVDAARNLYIADIFNIRVRKVTTAGIITTVAGNGQYDYSRCASGAAISASLGEPSSVTVDAAGGLYVGDSANDCILKVGASGAIITVAGNGFHGFSGDGGLATGASMRFPDGVAVDAAGNLYIADSGNNRIRKVGADGIITTVAGDGTAAFSGDGGPATGASLAGPRGVAVDAAGNLYIADSSNARVRKVSFGAAPGIPSIFSGGVVNAASFAKAPAPVCPGSIVSIFGNGLATGTGGATTTPLPGTLNGAQVLMNGRVAPLFFVSPGQINAQIPWEVSGGSNVNVQVVVNGLPSNTVTVSLAGECPGIFTTSGSGSGSGVVVHASDSSLVTSSNPVRPGESLIFWANGLGQVTNPPLSGSPALGDPLSVTLKTPQVVLGGVQATVLFAGLAPGFVGLYQINIRVPDNAVGGDATPLVIIIDDQQANVATVAVDAPGPPPLEFTAPSALPDARVGEFYWFSFCTPVPLGLSGQLPSPGRLSQGLCGFPVTGIPFGGIPPYHFQLDSGVGFPPFGLFLNLNGILAGTPTIAGTRTFRVTAVDLAGAQASQTVTLVVNPAPGFTLTVTKAGTGTGTVTSAPAGIDCGNTCTATFAAGTQVTLTATAASGSTFSGWTGACTAAGSCTVTMDGNKTVTASFTLANPTYTLAVTKAGTGSGTVTSTPAGINCGATCAASYPAGTSVTLTATPASGSAFAGWSGACTGTGSCSVALDSNKGVTATFNTVPVELSLNITSATCTKIAFDPLFGYLKVVISGTASGPVGAAVYSGIFQLNSGECSAWTAGAGCTRGSSQAANTSWTIARGGFTGTSNWFFSVYSPGPPEQEVKKTATLTCPLPY